MQHSTTLIATSDLLTEAQTRYDDYKAFSQDEVIESLLGAETLDGRDLTEPTEAAAAMMAEWQADPEGGLDWAKLRADRIAKLVAWGKELADAPPPSRQRGEEQADNVENLREVFEREQVENAARHAAEAKAATEPKPEFFNDAELLGVETPAYLNMLAKPLTFLTGEVWGAKDRRNTQDGDWKTMPMVWQHWLVGGAGTKALPAWGASRHPEGKNKEGNCIVLGSSIGGARKAKAMDEMYAMGLDIDSGARLKDVLAKIKELGLFCLVYTSYNNGKRGLELKRDDVMRKLKIDTDPSIVQVRQYLREHDKNRYEETFIAEVGIVEGKRQTKDGVVIALSTPPLEKFRLIFPLAEPVKLINLAETQQAALDLWEDKITGLAQNVLGVNFDTSCTDPSRLFYTARHAKGSDDWYCAIVRGDPLRFEDVKPMKKSLYTATRNTSDPFALAGGGDDADKPPMALTPSGASLNAWHTGAKDRFQLADLLDTECPDKIRNAGGEKQGTVHTECPFETEHTTEGGTATMAINAIDSESEYWTWFCHHDACQGRHKLQFLEKALADGWFEEELLHSEDYLLPSDDEDDKTDVEKARDKAEADAKGDDYVARIERECNADTTADQVWDRIEEAHKAGVSLGKRDEITDALERLTKIKPGQCATIWETLDDEARRKELEGTPAGEFIVWAEHVTKTTPKAEIRKKISAAIGTEAADVWENVRDVLAKRSALTATELKQLWTDETAKAARAADAAEARKRAAMKTPDYVSLAEATPEAVQAGAAASKWLPRGFTHSGGWFCQTGEAPLRIAREFEVLYSSDGKKGSTRTNEVAIRYQHRNRKFGIVESTFRIGDTYKDSGTILGRLRNEGLEFAANAPTDAILALLRGVNSDREAVYVERSGWLPERHVYVCPTGEVVKQDGDKCLYVLDHTMRVSAEKAGTLEQAIEAADTALRGRNAKRFLPGFLGGAVGCLADFLEEELAVIVANEGKAKHGKSTALKAGVSWFAMAAADGLLITGNVTATAMEVMAVKASGAMFAPDEQGTSKATAEDEQAMVLQYAGRIGRARGKTDGSLRDVQQWHGCMGMSTEHGLLNRLEAEQAQNSTVDIRSGALSRIFTVNYDSAVTLDRVTDADELAAYDVLAHGGAYGWLGPKFAKALLELGVEAVRGRVSALEAEWGEKRAGAADRVVKTAALFGVAAGITQEAGLLPSDIDLKGMLADLLTETLDQRAHHLDTDRQTLDTLRRNIIRMVNRRQIVAVRSADEARGEVLGYWDGPASIAADLSTRTYILPVDRLGMLVKTEVSALVEQLRGEGALVLPSEKTKHYKAGFWENTPGEGKKIKSLRVSGNWVHGDDRDAEGEDAPETA